MDVAQLLRAPELTESFVDMLLEVGLAHVIAGQALQESVLALIPLYITRNECPLRTEALPASISTSSVLTGGPMAGRHFKRTKCCYM